MQIAPDEPDRTMPHPAPVASTSSPPPPAARPRLVDPADPDSNSPAPRGPIDAQPPQKRKVVLLKRPATPTGDPRSDEQPVAAGAAEAIGSRERQPTATTAPGDPPYGHARAGGAAAAAADDEAELALDPVLHGALNHPRDRFLLLRAEVELERFILNQTYA